MKKLVSIILILVGVLAISSITWAEQAMPKLDPADLESQGMFEVYHISGPMAADMIKQHGGNLLFDSKGHRIAILTPDGENSKIEGLGEFEVKIVHGASALRVMDIFQHKVVIDFDHKVIYILDIPKES